MHVPSWLTSNASLSLCMVLVNIEVSIIGTSLVAITNDLHGFDQMGWVVTGYLITYTGEFRLAWAWTKFYQCFPQLWSLFGRKSVTYLAESQLFLPLSRSSPSSPEVVVPRKQWHNCEKFIRFRQFELIRKLIRFIELFAEYSRVSGPQDASRWLWP